MLATSQWGFLVQKTKQIRSEMWACAGDRPALNPRERVLTGGRTSALGTLSSCVVVPTAGQKLKAKRTVLVPATRGHCLLRPTLLHQFTAGVVASARSRA